MISNETKSNIRDSILYHCPKKFAHSYLYNRNHSNKIDFNNPTTYDEKIHWLMVYKYDETYGKYADKIAVREYVKEVGFSNLLIPLEGRGIYLSADQINFCELPRNYIIKANHGSGEKYYSICKDLTKPEEKELIKKMNLALKMNFAKHFCQYHYASIKPALICEKYLVTDGQERLNDYKVVCSYGKPIAILVCRDRNNGRDYYTPDWQYLEYTKHEYRSGLIEERPIVLHEMLDAASALSRPFPLARIDFYVVNNKLYFGEITLTPSEGIHRNLNEKAQIELGARIAL